mgnify:CR=1 FL=1
MNSEEESRKWVTIMNSNFLVKLTIHGFITAGRSLLEKSSYGKTDEVYTAGTVVALAKLLGIESFIRSLEVAGYDFPNKVRYISEKYGIIKDLKEGVLRSIDENEIKILTFLFELALLELKVGLTPQIDNYWLGEVVTGLKLIKKESLITSLLRLLKIDSKWYEHILE